MELQTFTKTFLFRTQGIKGETINGMFHVRTEDFETYPDISDSDRENIRNFLKDNNVVID